MKKIFLAILVSLSASGASFAELEGGNGIIDTWDNCPGPACPATNPGDAAMEIPDALREAELRELDRGIPPNERQAVEREIQQRY